MLIETPTLKIDSISVGPMDNNVYFVTCRQTGISVIVDAAAEPDRIIEAVDSLTVVAILTTHGHHDHIGAAEAVSERLRIPFRLHAADADIAGRSIDEPLAAGNVEVGNLSVAALHTPGHTPGSMCFSIGSVLITGDTLFPGGPGATRFPYSSFTQIMDSLRGKLFTFGDDTMVLPGHGTTTTIGNERPQLDAWQARGW